MKIKSLTQKTMLEIDDNDVLIIEDAQETKHITVSDLRNYLLSSGVTVETKKLINQTLETISASILAAKYAIAEVKEYEIAATIVDVENLHLQIKDVATGLFLTVEELATLLVDTEYTLQMLVDSVYEVPDVTPIVSDDGVIKAHFANLSQNAVAAVICNDIKMEIPETEFIKYQFTASPDLFVNNVTYVEEVE